MNDSIDTNEISPYTETVCMQESPVRGSSSILSQKVAKEQLSHQAVDKTPITTQNRCEVVPQTTNNTMPLTMIVDTNSLEIDK